MLKNIVVSVIGLLFVIVIDAQSQGPPPSPRELSNPIQEQNTIKQQPSQSDQRATEQSPLIVKTINPPNIQAETNQERSDREGKAANDRHLVWFTGLLVLFTAVLAAVGFWQGRQLKRSVDSLCNAERAYIFAKVKRHPDSKPGQIIESIKEGYNQARIIATNHGKTPAIITKANWYVGVFEDIEIDNKITELEYLSDSAIPPSIIINSGDTKKGIPDCIVSISEINKIDITANYVCFGRIDYKDIFDKIHTTIFCWKDNGVFFAPDENPNRNYHT
jgi:hypothetical protein